MMQQHLRGTLPGSPSTQPEMIDFIIDFWSQLRVHDDPGSTTWEILDDLELQVSDAICTPDRNIDLACRLTAKAMCLMAGRIVT